MRGHVPVADLADYGIELPADSEAYNSIGGLVFNDLGRLPKRGDKIDVNGYELRVESVRENRIVLVRVRERHGATSRQPGPTPGGRGTEPLSGPRPGGCAGRRALLGGGAVARYVSRQGVCGAPLKPQLKDALELPQGPGGRSRAPLLRETLAQRRRDRHGPALLAVVDDLHAVAVGEQPLADAHLEVGARSW